jgi:hypothetical protein
MDIEDCNAADQPNVVEPIRANDLITVKSLPDAPGRSDQAVSAAELHGLEH